MRREYSLLIDGWEPGWARPTRVVGLRRRRWDVSDAIYSTDGVLVLLVHHRRVRTNQPQDLWESSHAMGGLTNG